MYEQLLLLAELSVGLAGFSSIIVVFRRGASGHSWIPEDVFRLRIMLSHSLLGALFAIAPAGLMGLGIPDNLVISSASLLLALFFGTNLILGLRRFQALPAGSLSRPIVGVLSFGSLFFMAVAGLNAFFLLPSAGLGPYVASVTWLLISAGVMFYRLVTAPLGSEGA